MKQVTLYTLKKEIVNLLDGQEYMQFYSKEPNVYPVRDSDELIIPRDRGEVELNQVPVEKFVVNSLTHTKSGYYVADTKTSYFVLDPEIRKVIGTEVTKMNGMEIRICDLEKALRDKSDEMHDMQKSLDNAWETAYEYDKLYHKYMFMGFWEKLLFLFGVLK